MSGELSGGALAEETPQFTASQLGNLAWDVLSSYAALPKETPFIDIANWDAVMDAMSEAYSDAWGDHHDAAGNLLDSACGYRLAAYAAFYLVRSHRLIFNKGLEPTPQRFRKGIAGVAAPPYLQGCALLVAQSVVDSTVGVNMSMGLKRSLAQPPVEDMIRTLNMVSAGASGVTANVAAGDLEQNLRRIAAKKRYWARRIPKPIRRHWRLTLSVVTALTVGSAAATAWSYAAWHREDLAPPPAVGTPPAVEVGSAVASNVTQKLMVTPVGSKAAPLEIDPWAAPPVSPVVLVLDDPLRSQLSIEVKLRLSNSQGEKPGLWLKAGWAAGTMAVSGQTTITNAAHDQPQGIGDLQKPEDKITISLDPDPDAGLGPGLETTVKMMLSVNPGDEHQLGDNAKNFFCGYNPAPGSILLTTPGEKRPILVTAIPIYVVKNC